MEYVDQSVVSDTVNVSRFHGVIDPLPRSTDATVILFYSS